MKSSREFEAITRCYLRLLRDTLMNVHYRARAATAFSDSELQVAREAIESVKTKHGQLLDCKDIPQSNEVQAVLTTVTPEVLCAGLNNNRIEGHTLLDESSMDNIEFCARNVPARNVERIALLRTGADYYESTMDILNSLYPKVSVGGMVIVDDYGAYLLGARRAVNEYRAANGITCPIVTVNEQVVFWRKTR